MPTQKNQSQIQLIRGMDDKIASLEAEMSGMKTTLANMEHNQTRLIALFEKSLGKKITTEEERVADDTGEGSVHRSTPASNNQLEGEALAEFRRSVKKVELPTFDGEDPAGWISRAEVYFRVQDTRPEVKVNLAQLCMEGPTIHFFNSLINENEDLTWDRLKEALLERYGGHGEGDVYEQLTELRQKGTVDEYITDFEYLTAQIPKLHEKQFLGYFLHGLKEEIRGKVRSLTVVGDLSRSKVLQVARTVERETKRDYGPGYNKSHKPGHGSNRVGPNGSNKNDWVFVNNKESGSAGGQGLSYNELMERKQKGLCFKCGGAFHPMHQCPDRQLKVLIVDDEEAEEQGGKLLAVEVESEEEEVQGEMSMLEFQQFQQLNQQRGSRLQVIKLRGTIHEVPVVILVDSGASHNFISQHLVHKMNWKTMEGPPMSIKLGDGSCAKTKGVCEDLEIGMEGLKIRVDVQIFDLGCVDVVLGIEWLRTLGDMIVNWQKQTMSFWFNKEWVTVKGMEDQLGVMETLHSVLCKPWWNGVAGWKGVKNKVNSGVFHTLEEEKSQELEQLLNLCAEVFQDPKGLPPKRMKEHVIALKEGEEAVNVRPYRYPYHHKNEIERQVKEMLSNGIIRPSTSSFSSPVILVKKKDGTWRMCIDYRA
ncbi:RNA-directed DNA polymerase (Reverse transcriptase), partial [Trifolium medium]|nr:RNA-directed DNA polymerase (Reverse transcriptase) [Trifolium medium]